MSDVLPRLSVAIALSAACLAPLPAAAETPPAWAGNGPAPCDMLDPCAVPEGTYMAQPPAGWDGKSPITAAVWFHGYQQSAEEVMNDAEIARSFSDAGILLIVPEGRDHRWSFPSGPPSPHPRDETAFIGAVLADATARFALQPGKIVAAGFSIGGSMVWTAACTTPGRFSAYVAFSGDFWEPLPPACADGRVRLMHIHGTADRTFPIAGRAIGAQWHQGNAMTGLALWRKWKSCPAPKPTAAIADLACTETGPCPDGSRIAYCQHDREHEVDPLWVKAGIDWVKARWAEDDKR